MRIIDWVAFVLFMAAPWVLLGCSLMEGRLSASWAFYIVFMGILINVTVIRMFKIGRR
jgi:hypothetical protein